MSKEPVVYVNAISAVIVAVLPVLLAFGILNWTAEQFGVVETFVIAATAIAASVFTRSRVSPVKG
jgi:hypothetical protein